MIGSFLGRLFGKVQIEQSLQKEATKEIDYNQQYEYELRPAMMVTKIGFITSIVLLLTSAVLLVIMFSELNSDSIIGISVLAVGGILLLLFSIDNTVKYVKISNNIIESNSLFSTLTEVKFDKIDRVVFKEKKLFELYSNGEKIVIFKAFIGSGFVLRMIYDKLDIKVYIVSLLSNRYFLSLFLNNLSEGEVQRFKEDINNL